MAITLFGYASNPADNGTGTTAPVVVTPPGSMQAGDLVFVTVCFSGTSGTLAVIAAGGQTWTSLTTQNQTRNRMRSFWCVFDGTWDTSPSWTGSGTSNVIAKMVVFRPDGETNSTWVNEVAESSGIYVAPTTPYTVTNTGQTTTHPNCVVIAGWTSRDDNTWTSLAGTGWALAGGAQVRNTSGTYQQSAAHAYRVMATQGASGDVSYNQNAGAGDAGTRIIISFREVQSPTTVQAIFTATADQPATVQYGSAVNVPAVIEAVGDQPTPLVNTGDTVTLEPIAGTFSPIDPLMAGPRTAVADLITVEASQVEPVVIGGAVPVQSVQTLTGSQPEPVLSASGVSVQSIITGELSQPAPAVEAFDLPDATAQPDAITGQFSFASAPAVAIDAIHVAAEITAQASAVEPGYVGPTTGDVTVAVNPVDVTADVPELSIFARALVAIEAAITGLFQTLAPVLAGTLLYVAEPVLAVADQPEPVIQAGAQVTPEPIEVTAATIDPVMAGAVIVVPAPITGTFSVASAPDLSIEARYVIGEVTATGTLPEPTAVLGGDVLVPILETIDATASLVEPTTALVTVVAVEPIDGEFSQPENTFSIGHAEVASPITGEFSQVEPEVHPQNIVSRQDWPIPGYWELCEPTLSISSAPVVIQDALEVTALPQEPVVVARAVVVAELIEATAELVEPTVSWAGNITVIPAIISALAEPIDGTVTAEAFISPEPIDATLEILDPAIALELETLVAVEPIDCLAILSDGDTTAEALTVPEPIEATASQPTQTEAGTALVALDVIEAVADQPEPSIATAGNITVRPDPITGIVSLASDAGTAVDTIAVLSEVDGVLDQPDPLVWNTPVTVEVEPIAGEFDQPTPSVGSAINWTVGVEPIVGTFSVASEPVIGLGPLVVVAPIEATASLLVTGFGAGAQVTPAPITGTFTPFTPTVNAAIESVTVAPAPITGTFDLNFFEFSIDAELVPYETTATGDQPTPTLYGSAVVVVAPITGTFSQPTPALLTDGGVLVSPDVLTGTLTLADPTLGQGVTIAVEPVTGELSLPAPNVAIGDVASVTTTPTPLTGTFSQPTPTPSTTTSVTTAPEPITGTFSQPVAAAALPKSFATESLTASLTLYDPLVLINSALIVPVPLTAIGTPLEPSILATAGKFNKPILKDVTGRKRIYDVTILDPLADAAERQGIIDIYIGRN